MAINNPYVPGDPFSYDLKWIVRKIKEHSTILSTLDETITEKIVQLLDQHDPLYWPTAADLIASDMKTPSLAYIEGFYAAGDGGGNLYYVTSDYNDVLAADFYLTLNGANRWAVPIIMTPYITPQMFGAHADGSEDASEAVQAVFDAVVPKGGVVYFPTGRYRIEQSITVNDQRDDICLTVCGDGDGSMIELPSDLDAFVFPYQSTLLNVKDLRFRSVDTAKNSSSVFRFQNGVYRARFTNIRYDIDNEGDPTPHYGWSFFAAPDTSVTDTISFTDCYMEHIDGPAIKLGQGSSVWITGGRIVGTGFTIGRTTSIGMECSGNMGGVYITSVDLIQLHKGLYIHDAISTSNREFFISNATFDGDDYGIDVHDDSVVYVGSTWIATSKINCVHTAAGHYAEIVISGGTIQQAGQTAGTLANGVYMESGTLIIDGVSIKHCTADGIKTAAGSEASISNCRFFNNANAITIAGTASIKDNVFRYNTTQSISVSASIYLSGNDGLTINFTTPAMIASNTGITNDYSRTYQVHIVSTSVVATYLNGSAFDTAATTDVILNPGDVLSIGYVDTPTWVWTAIK